MTKTLTEEGNRKKQCKPLTNTVFSKAIGLVEKVQADVAVFVKPYDEEIVLAYKSRPGFPDFTQASS